MKKLFVLFILLVGISGCLTIQKKTVSESCQHEWTEGPYFIRVLTGIAEPKEYSMKDVKVNQCFLCGQVQLLPDFKVIKDTFITLTTSDNQTTTTPTEGN